MSRLFPNVQVPSIVISKPTQDRMEAREVVQEINGDVDDFDPSLAESQFFVKGYFVEATKAMGCVDMQSTKEEGWQLVDLKETDIAHQNKPLQSPHSEAVTASHEIKVNVEEAFVIIEHEDPKDELDPLFPGYIRSGIPVHYPLSIVTSKAVFPKVGAKPMDYTYTYTNNGGLMPGGAYLHN